MITLEQIKQDIASGKSTRIYYSANTLWWTHLDSDVDESTKQGVKFRQERHNEMMKNPNVPQSHKDHMNELLANIDTMHQIPLDPYSSPLYQFTDQIDIDKWINVAEQKPEFFGKHGLDAFIKTHHQNHNKELTNWDMVNDYIDNLSNIN